jgi:hypothetical protein
MSGNIGIIMMVTLWGLHAGVLEVEEDEVGVEEETVELVELLDVDELDEVCREGFSILRSRHPIVYV